MAKVICIRSKQEIVSSEELEIQQVSTLLLRAECLLHDLGLKDGAELAHKSLNKVAAYVMQKSLENYRRVKAQE